MITTVDLAAQLAEKYDVDKTTAVAAVETYAGKVSDDPVMYDPTTKMLTDAGAEVVREEFADDHNTDGQR